MLSYRDRTYCDFTECVKHSPEFCNRVLTDYDLKYIMEGKYLVCFYIDKPDCYFSGKGMYGDK